MPQQIVECIPNFSEARRPEVVEQIVQAITAIDGITMLDRHSDLDHNRTVLTFAGAPGPVAEAAFAGIVAAARLINLDEHQGEHPRIGAADVIPFVPISGISMAECVELARKLGRRVGEELGVPVYLYEEAALRPERVNLEDVRRGQYEAFKQEIGVKPERDPDYGPKQATPAGASVIGARQPLIAFNVYLTTEDVSIARKVAKAVRNSSGGLRYVKGLGLLVDGRAQVSMNLTNFRATPIARVVEFVRREAERYGVGIHHCELVGLVPQEALVDAAVWYTQLDQFEPEQILEQRLQSVDGNSSAAGQQASAFGFLDALASGEATPGGGSAAAYAGAMAAALASMVARLTIGRKKYAAVQAEMQSVVEEAEEIRAAQQRAIDEDAQSFLAVMKAMKLPKDTPEQEQIRKQAIEAATLEASRVPLQTARRAVRTLELLHAVADGGNLNAITDAGAGAAMAKACLRAAGLNVRINLASLSDPAPANELNEALASLEDKAAVLQKRIQEALNDRGGPALA